MSQVIGSIELVRGGVYPLEPNMTGDTGKPNFKVVEFWDL